MDAIFFEITVIFLLAAFLSFIFRLLKQPPILAYILAGIIIGPIGLLHLQHELVFESFAGIGVTFLLFILGLELNVSELKRVGKTALFTGIGQIVFTSLIGYLLVLAFGFSYIASFYIAIGLTFSSTIIVVKLLTDKKDLNTLYGRIAVGFLLIQDFFAIVALILLSGLNGAEGAGIWLNFGTVLLKGAVLFGAVIYLSNSLLPKVVKFIARSSEILFLFSIAWVFGFSALVSSPWVGFSIEIGGFLAGLALAHSAQHLHIASRMRSLRDFFIILFFINLGLTMMVANVGNVIIPAIALSFFVLVGNPIIVMIIMGLLGYRSKTSFFAGLTVAQISEFSLIVIFLGSKLGHVDDDVITLLTIVGIVTFVLSTYMIMNNAKLYAILRPILKIFEKKRGKSDHVKSVSELDDHVVLVGASRMGENVLKTLGKRTDNLVVVDMNPEIIEKLKKQKIAAFFGDITDHEIQQKARIDTAKLVVSTIPFLEDNLALLAHLRQVKGKAKVVISAQDRQSALLLYELGADYVIVPHLSAGRHLSDIIKLSRLEDIEEERKADLEYIKGLL